LGDSYEQQEEDRSNPATTPQTLKIGSRVRCSDDGIEGRIVWANAVSVKIRWDDGEQITWRRDALADRPIEILDTVCDDDQLESPEIPDALAPTAPTEPGQTEPEVPPSTCGSAAPEHAAAEPPAEPAAPETPPVEQPAGVPSTELIEVPVIIAMEQTREDATHTEQIPMSETAEEKHNPPEQTDQPKETSTSKKRTRMRKPKAADDRREKRLSALDAAAKVLEETGRAMTCPELIMAMAEKGYWTSPGGKTPAATLYSAMLRESTTKGAASRFVKAERGKFALRGAI